jgi:large subunit ribosomal protein L7A
MLERIKQCRKFVVGRKQVLKAIMADETEEIYVALNAEQKIIRDVMDAANNKGIKVNTVPTMKELGLGCKIQVGAACAAIIKEV